MSKAKAKNPAWDQVPGAPTSEPPTVERPAPRESLPDPKADQGRPEAVSPTGTATGAPERSRAQSGPFLTTAQGVRLSDTDHSLKAGSRGPTLLQDHHFREKITHFDHERIPERVVHARGTGAHGVFTSYGTAANLTRAGFLAEQVETPVFVRFSTVVGSRGSADTVRDTRGFATKFYTDEGTFDLVGNNMPVFFIQDGIKFPDVIHAAKPHPDREIPQAQTAHDSFWDFVSLHTESAHHLMWAMSDRGIPRSYRTMEGFGVHTFRLINADNQTVLAKFHWKPVLGVHSLVWEEALMLAGFDPDFHRRDLAEAIESGAFPQYEFGLQVFPDNPEQTFEGIDLLDPTKIVPEELAPVQPVGLLTLNANPTNFFAEVEQIAFHTGHLVPGIDATDDPLLQARNFSYLDTQLSRLGGPNFMQIPINRPHAPVNDMLRDGMHQTAVHEGIAPYQPNSLDAGAPFPSTAAAGALIEVPQPVQGTKVRENPTSFSDHFSQARLFYLSLAPVEQQHLADAITFELGKCYETPIRERSLTLIANIDTDLAATVAAGLGLPAPAEVEDLASVTPSPALSQVGKVWPVDGRKVGIVVLEDADLSEVSKLRTLLLAANVVPLLIAPVGGTLPSSKGPLTVQRTFATARSVEVDAAVVVGGTADATAVDPRVSLLVSEAVRHGKSIGGWGGAADLLATFGLEAGVAGALVGDDADEVAAQLLNDLAKHRVWA